MNNKIVDNLRKREKQKAFTLIELMVVISIISLLASIVLVSVKRAKDKADIAKIMTFSQGVQKVLGGYAVGVWSFEDGVGAVTAKDSSGQGNDGVISGATFFEITPKKETGAGGGSYSLYFDGTTDYIDVPYNSSLDFTKEITIEAWVNMSKSPVEAYELIQKPGNYIMYLYTAGASPRVMMSVTIGGATRYPQGSSVIGGYEEWHHIVGVYDGSTIKNYVDGSIAASADLTGAMDTSANGLRINGRQLHKGFIDEVRIYNKALSTQAIREHYLAGLEARQDIAKK